MIFLRSLLFILTFLTCAPAFAMQGEGPSSAAVEAPRARREVHKVTEDLYVAPMDGHYLVMERARTLEDLQKWDDFLDQDRNANYPEAARQLSDGFSPFVRHDPLDSTNPGFLAWYNNEMTLEDGRRIVPARIANSPEELLRLLKRWHQLRINQEQGREFFQTQVAAARSAWEKGEAVDFWGAYSVTADDMPCRGLQSGDKVEMLVSSMTQKNVPLMCHMGIGRPMRYLFANIEERIARAVEPAAPASAVAYPEHPGLAVSLHAFAARIARTVYSDKVYMSTRPIMQMERILRAALPEGTWWKGEETLDLVGGATQFGSPVRCAGTWKMRESTQYSLGGRYYCHYHEGDAEFDWRLYASEDIRNAHAKPIFQLQGAQESYDWFFKAGQHSLFTVRLDTLADMF